MADDPSPRRNGKLSIPLPFNEALRVALKAKPPPKPAKPKRKPRKKIKK